MLEPRFLTTKDIIAIKKACGCDLFKMALDASSKINDSESIDTAFPIELIDAINDHVRGEEGKNLKLADSIAFAMKCFGLTFGDESEKKS